MKKTRHMTWAVTALAAAFLLAAAVGLAACGEKKEDSPSVPAEPAAGVYLETSFFTGWDYIGTTSLVFYDDNTVSVSNSDYAALDAVVPWQFSDGGDSITFEWGEGDPEWKVELVKMDGEVVSLYITSESGISMLQGPFVAYPAGILAALRTDDVIMGHTGSVIVLYDDGTGNMNFYWSSSVFPSEFEMDGDTLTFPVNGSPVTGTVTRDAAGKISGLTIDSVLGAENVEFFPLGI